MAKPNIEIEINLVELIQILWQHRLRFIFTGLLGLFLGVGYTFYQEPRYVTDFNFVIGHPYITETVLESSMFLKSELNESKLNPNKLPYYSFDKKTQTYSIKSDTAEIQNTVRSLLTSAFKNEINNLKRIAETAGYNNHQVILDRSPISFNLLVNISNKDIANLNADEMVNYLKINFSKTKTIYPTPWNHGLLGGFIGLILGFMWIILSINIRKFNAAGPRLKA